MTSECPLLPSRCCLKDSSVVWAWRTSWRNSSRLPACNRLWHSGWLPCSRSQQQDSSISCALLDTHTHAHTELQWRPCTTSHKTRVYAYVVSWPVTCSILPVWSSKRNSLSKLLKRATCLLERYWTITTKPKPYSSFLSVSLSLRGAYCKKHRQSYLA